ncbi:hypothetical protein [Leeia aquatica]|uniref:Uncharacterized protein n=1 Tax=Leeia aquatica TaxID=2725557 RepID=A0A847S7P2_9NEIS|nr:hypothetical protein [Leeia aquatica]NLR75964.1 hypothetical protein [Leeia aquatica]
MKYQNDEHVRKAIVDVSKEDIVLDNGAFYPAEALTQRLAQLVEKGRGFAVVCGARALLERHGMSLEENKGAVFALYETLFRKAMSCIDLDRYNITHRPIDLNYMDVDGYGVNKQFSHDGKVAGREYVTTKCIHFDTATPFVANVYGPNRNIAGGYPVVTEIQQYCADKGIPAREIVTNIPQNYNMAIKPEHYAELLNDYSFCLKMDFERDMVMVMLSNEIEFGVAHGATDPMPKVPGVESYRPIRHYEYQYSEESHYDEWLAYYSLPLSNVTDYDGSVPLGIDYYKTGGQVRHVVEYTN